MKNIRIVAFLAIWGGASGVADPRRSHHYTPPKPHFEVFAPQGLIVWIPAETGITSFTFHGKLNEQFSAQYDVGHWAQTISKTRNGRYLFIDREAKLQIGDTVYYRTVAVRHGLTHRNTGSFTVKQLRPAATTPSPVEVTDGPEIPTFPFALKNNERRTKDVRTIATQTSVGANEREQGRCAESRTIVHGAKVCPGELLFDEQFNGNALDKRKWRIENRFASDPDNEFVVYADFQENLQVRSGKLAIRPTLFESKFGPGSTNRLFQFADECTGDRSSRDCIRDTRIDFDMVPPVLSSQISTVNSFRFTYGKVVIRAKLPRGDWIFPQLQLTPATNFYGIDGYASGLMRVAFVPGGPRLRNQLSGGLILSDQEPLRCSKMCTLKRQTNWNDNFHEFALSWTPDGVFMEVDNEVYCTIDPEDGFYQTVKAIKPQVANLWRVSGNKIAPFDKEFYVTIGIGVGGHYDFHIMREKPWVELGVKATYAFWNARESWYPTWNSNSTLLVDYVRVYAI